MTQLVPGGRGRVTTIEGGGFGLRRHLASLGILPGTELRLIRGQQHGAVIVEIGEGRFVLGRGMAHRVIVEALGQEPSQP